MNLRVTKKDIEFFIGEFIDDCTLYVALNPNCDTTGVDKIINEAVDLYNDLRNKVSTLPEELQSPAKKRTPAQRQDKATVSAETAARSKKLAAYYKGIRKELAEKLDTLSEELSGLIAAATPAEA
ncbi:MAG: hypothetical protein LUC24_00940 [Bacteroidales bacterium]|nr:hypothetical protein [Bacteroidales bacterium]